jgi:hypothetical protein
LAAHAWPEKWTACWLPVKWPAKSRQSTKHYPRPWSMAKYWLGSRWLQSKRAVCDRHETLCFIKGAVAIEELGWRWAGGGGGGGGGATSPYNYNLSSNRSYQAQIDSSPLSIHK